VTALHNEEIRNLRSSQNIVWNIKINKAETREERATNGVNGKL
jgi:hypothetical protein